LLRGASLLLSPFAATVVSVGVIAQASAPIILSGTSVVASAFASKWGDLESMALDNKELLIENGEQYESNWYDPVSKGPSTR